MSTSQFVSIKEWQLLEGSLLVLGYSRIGLSYRTHPIGICSNKNVAVITVSILVFPLIVYNTAIKISSKTLQAENDGESKAGSQATSGENLVKPLPVRKWMAGQEGQAFKPPTRGGEQVIYKQIGLYLNSPQPIWVVNIARDINLYSVGLQ